MQAPSRSKQRRITTRRPSFFAVRWKSSLPSAPTFGFLPLAAADPAPRARRPNSWARSLIARLLGGEAEDAGLALELVDLVQPLDELPRGGVEGTCLPLGHRRRHLLQVNGSDADVGDQLLEAPRVGPDRVDRLELCDRPLEVLDRGGEVLGVG